jgi:hypothetical protein
VGQALGLHFLHDAGAVDLDRSVANVDGVQDPDSRAVNRSLGISRYTMLAIAGFWRTPRPCFAEIGSQSIRKQR